MGHENLGGVPRTVDVDGVVRTLPEGHPVEEEGGRLFIDFEGRRYLLGSRIVNGERIDAWVPDLDATLVP
jgi:hypothetical protein